MLYYYVFVRPGDYSTVVLTSRLADLLTRGERFLVPLPHIFLTVQLVGTSRITNRRLIVSTKDVTSRH